MLSAPAIPPLEAAPAAAAGPAAVAPTNTPADAAELAAAQSAADELTAAPPTSHGHTLLDNWIDVRLIGRRTAAVAQLVVGPQAAFLDRWSRPSRS